MARGASQLNLVGGVAIGDAGAVGTLYEGYKLAGGTDFTSLSKITPTDPSGQLFPAHRRRGRRAINSASNDYYWDEKHTGFDDLNRGVPVGPTDIVYQSGSSVFLGSRLSTTAEKAADWSTSASTGPDRPQASSSLHAAGYQGAKWPCIIEARVKIPTPTQMASGGWPAFWCENMLPPWPDTGEWDFEWKDNAALYLNFIDGNGSANDETYAGTIAADHSASAFRTLTFVATANNLKYYVDGVLKQTSNKRPTDIVTGPMFWWLRLGVDLTPGIYGMTYSAAAWAGKTPVMEVDWVRVWSAAAGTNLGYKGVVQTINVASNASMNATLPSEVSLWGSGSYTEWLVVQPFEDNAPGMSQVPGTTNYSNWYGQTPASNYAGPTICTWNRATRSFQGSSWDNAGRMFAHLIAWDDTNGGLAGVARIVVNVGPKLQASTVEYTVGAAFSYDLYAVCDCGDLVTNGTTKTKTIAVSGLPAWASYSDTTGLITGSNPTDTGTSSLTITITNSLGQTGGGTISLQKASGAVSSFSTDFTAANANLEDAGLGFTRVDGIAGGLTIVSNDVNIVDTSSTGTAYKSPAVTPGNKSMVVRFGTGISGFACHRLTDSNNFLGIRRNGSNQIEVYKRISGTLTLQVQSTNTITSTDDVQFDDLGGTIAVKKNGTDITINTGSLTLSTVPPSSDREGLVGRVATATAAFKQFSITAI